MRVERRVDPTVLFVTLYTIHDLIEVVAAYLSVAGGYTRQVYHSLSLIS